MENDNYDLLLQKITDLEKKVDETGKRIDDVTDFNRTLLNTKEPTQPQKSKAERQAYLKEKLEGGLGYGSK